MFRLLVLTVLLTHIPLTAAVERDYFGEGQVLLFPFFNAENGWNTYLNIAIPSARESILKLRVLDGVDGAVVNTFNIYTHRYENWRAAIGQDSDGQPILRVAEGACTISESGSFGGEGTVFPLSTRTGMAEVYLVSYDLRVVGDTLACNEIAARWQPGGIWTSDPLQDLRPRNRDIVGHFDLVHVEQGLSSEHSATGLKSFSESIPHTSPQNSSSPNLAEADPIAKLPSGEEVEPDSGQGIDAVALLLSTQDGYITNDVVNSVAIGASTDWVVTFPLRGYKTYGSYELEIDGMMRTCNEYDQSASEPSILGGLWSGHWTSWGGGEIAGNSSQLDITPEPPTPYAPFLCYSVNVLAFDERPSIFLPESSQLLTPVAAKLTPSSPSATVQYRFSDGRSSPDENEGRPVLAFRATTFVNGTLNGGSTLANYMILKPHKVD